MNRHKHGKPRTGPHSWDACGSRSREVITFLYVRWRGCTWNSSSSFGLLGSEKIRINRRESSKQLLRWTGPGVHTLREAAEGAGFVLLDREEAQGRSNSSLEPLEGIQNQRAQLPAVVADSIERTNGHQSQLGSFELGSRKKGERSTGTCYPEWLWNLHRWRLLTPPKPLLIWSSVANSHNVNGTQGNRIKRSLYGFCNSSWLLPTSAPWF